MEEIKKNTQRHLPLSPVTFVQFIGDSSGSMITQGTVPQKGAEQFCQKWNLLSNKNMIFLSFISFDSDMNIIYNGDASKMTIDNINECKKSMIPFGQTRLYDTVIHGLTTQMDSIKKYLKELSYYEKKIITNTDISKVTIINTDGYDNMSHNSKKEMDNAIQTYKQFGGTILFAAANLNAEIEGQSSGLNRSNCLQVDSSNHENAKNAYNVLTDVSIRMSSSSSNHRITFTDLERNRSCSTKELNRINPSSSSSSLSVVNPILSSSNNSSLSLYPCPSLSGV